MLHIFWVLAFLESLKDLILIWLKGLAMIFTGQENSLIIFRSKEIYIYFKANNKIPINLLK